VFYVTWVPFSEWCQRGGQARAHYWESQDFANLARGRYAQWVMRRRHWTEEPYLHEFMADLSVELAPSKRPED
jgi:hypothetical protein